MISSSRKTMSQIVFTNNDVPQQLGQLATYLNQLGYPLDIDVPQALENQSPVDLFREKLLPGCTLFWTEPTGRGFQRILNLLIALLQLDQEHFSHNCILIIEPMLATPTDKYEEKQYFLSQLFNTVPPTNPVRYQLLKYLIQLNIGAGEIEKTASDLIDSIDGLLNECKATNDQQQQVYSLIIQALKAEDPSLAFRYQLKQLATFNDATVKPAAIQLLKDALTLPTFFNYSQLLENPQLNAVKKEDLYALVEIFASASLPNFEKFRASKANFLKENALSVDQLVRKIRLLSLCNLLAPVAGSEKPTSFDEIAKALSVPSDQVEVLFIEAFKLKILEGKINQSDSTLITQRVFRSKFASEDWKVLQQKFAELRGKVSQMMQVVDKAKLVSDGQMDPATLVGR